MDRSRHTTVGSPLTEAALDSTTSRAVRPALTAGTFHVMVRAPVRCLPGPLLFLNEVPFGAFTVTLAPLTVALVGFATVTVEGYFSPGLTQPTEETKELCTVRPLAFEATRTAAAPASSAEKPAYDASTARTASWTAPSVASTADSSEAGMVVVKEPSGSATTSSAASTSPVASTSWRVKVAATASPTAPMRAWVTLATEPVTTRSSPGTTSARSSKETVSSFWPIVLARESGRSAAVAVAEDSVRGAAAPASTATARPAVRAPRNRRELEVVDMRTFGVG